MCLLIRIELHGVEPSTAAEIAEYSSSRHDLSVKATKPSKIAASFSVAEYAEGCACSLLADDADWNAPAWSFRPDVLPKLANVVRALLSRARGQVVLEALWIGNDADRTERVTTRQLLATIDAGSLGTKTRYVISR